MIDAKTHKTSNYDVALKHQRIWRCGRRSITKARAHRGKEDARDQVDLIRPQVMNLQIEQQRQQ